MQAEITTDSSKKGPSLLEVKDLQQYYPVSKSFFSNLLKKKTLEEKAQKNEAIVDVGKFVRAVDGISFSIGEGEIFALVGESGCGKTTTAKMIIGLVKPTSGSITFLGHEIAGLKGRKMKPFRKDIQMVFQDPYSSLDPRMTVGRVISEPLRAFGYSRQEQATKVRELLRDVGLRTENAEKKST